MAYFAQNQNGQATSANSAPVVLASDQSAVAIKSGFLESTGSANANGVIFTQDISTYRSISLQLSGTWSATVNIEVSDDNVNWTDFPLADTRLTTSGGSLGNLYNQLTTNRTLGGSLNTRYLRLRVSSYSSGSIVYTVEYYTHPYTSTFANTIALLAGGSNNVGNVGSSYSTGSTVPSAAFYAGVKDSSGNLQGLNAAAVNGDAGAGNNTLQTDIRLYNGATYDRLRSSGPVGTAAVAGTYIELSGLSAGSLNAIFLPSTDVSAYKWISLQINGTWSGNLNFQGSNDNTNWVSVNLNTTNGGVTISPSSGSNGLFVGPCSFRYFRVQMTAYNSGTATGVLELYTVAPVPYGISVGGANSQVSVIGNVGSQNSTGSAVPSGAFYLGVRDGTNLGGLTSGATNADSYTGSGALPITNYVWNGSSYDRTRTASSAGGTTGVGLVGAGMLGWDGSNYYRLRLGNSDNLSGGETLVATGGAFNNSSVDRMRNNTTGVIAAAGTTATTSNFGINTYNAKKLLLALSITGGSGSVTVAISGVTSSGITYTIVTSAALTGTGTYTTRVFPGATASAGSTTAGPTANDMLPRNLSVTLTVSGTVTYGCDWVLSV